MTLTNFIELYYAYDATKSYKKSRKETSGQTLMNFIALHRPDLYNILKTSNINSFYFIERTPLVWIYLHENWNKSINL